MGYIPEGSYAIQTANFKSKDGAESERAARSLSRPVSLQVLHKRTYRVPIESRLALMRYCISNCRNACKVWRHARSHSFTKRVHTHYMHNSVSVCTLAKGTSVKRRHGDGTGGARVCDHCCRKRYGTRHVPCISASGLPNWAVADLMNRQVVCCSVQLRLDVCLPRSMRRAAF